MATAKDTLWKLKPHTRAKHAILKRYLDAWMIILSQAKFPEILYIDGFAGPGEYADGEPGSPIIALEAAINHKTQISAKMHFLFVEKNLERARNLKQQIAKRNLPANFNVIIEGDASFEDVFEKRYSQFCRNGCLIPTFAFIDPFGWSGAPFNLVRKILTQPSCEVFVNFMYEEINRFLGQSQQVENFNDFFGTDAWKQCIEETDRKKRNSYLHGLYRKQLLTLCKYVRSFEMSNEKNVTDYFLFYATKSLSGLKRMKEAMWKVDGSGEFRFSDATDPNQLILFQKEPDRQFLGKQIVAKFNNREASVGEIEEYVVTETAFRESHYKKILNAMEKSDRLKIVTAPFGRKKGTFKNPEMIVRFAS